MATTTTTPTIPPHLWDVDELLMALRIAMRRGDVTRALITAHEVVALLTEKLDSTADDSAPCAVSPPVTP